MHIIFVSNALATGLQEFSLKTKEFSAQYAEQTLTTWLKAIAFLLTMKRKRRSLDILKTMFQIRDVLLKETLLLFAKLNLIAFTFIWDRKLIERLTRITNSN